MSASSTSSTLNAAKLPPQALKAVIRNVTSSKEPWVLFTLASNPPTCIPSKVLTRSQWLSIFSMVRDQIRDSLGNETLADSSQGDSNDGHEARQPWRQAPEEG